MFSTGLSSIASACEIFGRAFSASTVRSRRASDTASRRIWRSLIHHPRSYPVLRQGSAVCIPALIHPPPVRADSTDAWRDSAGSGHETGEDHPMTHVIPSAEPDKDANAGSSVWKPKQVV